MISKGRKGRPLTLRWAPDPLMTSGRLWRNKNGILRDFFRVKMHLFGKKNYGSGILEVCTKQICDQKK